MHDAVSAAWDRASNEWSDQARHDAVLRLAVDHGEFKWLAGKYKERKGDPIADAQLAKITNAAMATMFATATAKRDKDAASPYKRALLWLLVFMVLMVFGLIAAKLMAASHHRPSP